MTDSRWWQMFVGACLLFIAAPLIGFGVFWHDTLLVVEAGIGAGAGMVLMSEWRWR